MIHFHPPCLPQQVKILTEMEHIGTSSDIILLVIFPFYFN